jgi:hypothetical protein
MIPLTDALVPSCQVADLLKVFSGYTFVSTAYVFPHDNAGEPCAWDDKVTCAILHVEIAVGLH